MLTFLKFIGWVLFLAGVGGGLVLPIFTGQDVDRSHVLFVIVLGVGGALIIAVARHLSK